ncbi:MAG: GNAT family N-acetyltransferase [Cyanobacteria bacterium M_surface_7_m2_040]|nr:GNAT family N-acetyltransferase [Cyanobacteria bacterium K_Offshore_0m_m2_072]MBM5808569.1 GNAT family N-acetyltransferase [Cyanobacteria bacterium M_surface_9_m1_291]MBM5826522.1 GNAT family N-acetyltransferase [Cyanobacteria bacterium M_surface_7_m2_040]
MSSTPEQADHQLRPFQQADLPQLLRVYGEAVRSQCPGLYSPQQVQAWARHPLQHSAVAAAIERGWCLVNPVLPSAAAIAAFGVLEPLDRLSLLYCEGRWSRQGRANALLAALEEHARSQGVPRLRTEASQLSRPLLLRRGWQIDAEETVLFAGVSFVRWRMAKPLQN